MESNDLNDITADFARRVAESNRSSMRIETETKCSCPCHIVNVGGETDVCGFCGCAPNMKPIPRNYRELQRPVGENREGTGW